MRTFVSRKAKIHQKRHVTMESDRTVTLKRTSHITIDLQKRTYNNSFADSSITSII